MYSHCKRLLLLLCLVTVGLNAGSKTGAEPLSYHNLLERYKEKIVQVENQSPFISKETLLGNGIVVSPDGYIVTTDAMLSAMERVTLRLGQNPVPLTAQVVGRNKGADLALLKARPEEALPYLKLEKRTSTKVGDRTFLLFRGPNPGMRHGIVTSSREGIIISDIPVSGDIYGGVMIDVSGRFLGIISKKFSLQNRYATAVSAAHMARSVKALSKAHRTVHGFFGMSLDDLASSQYGIYGTDRGALITSVDSNKTAERAGLKKGDLIVRINGKRVTDREVFSEALYDAKAEDNVTIGYVRNRLHKEVEVRLPLVDQSVLNPNVFVHRGLVVEDISPAIRSMRELPPYLKGVYVTLVMPGSVAEARGLHPGDVIIQVGTKTIGDLSSFKANIGKSSRERLFIYRDGWNIIKLLAEEEKKK